MKTSLSKVVQKNVQKILAGLVVVKFGLFRIREHDIIHATCVLCSTLDEDIFDNSENFLVHHQRSNPNYRDTTRHRMYYLTNSACMRSTQFLPRHRSGIPTHFSDVGTFRIAFARQRASSRRQPPAKSDFNTFGDIISQTDPTQ